MLVHRCCCEEKKGGNARTIIVPFLLFLRAVISGKIIESIRKMSLGEKAPRRSVMERIFYKTDFFPRAILSIRKHKLTHPFLPNICGKRFDFFCHFSTFLLSETLLLRFYRRYQLLAGGERGERKGKGRG